MTEPSPPRLVDLTLDDSDTSSDQKRATPYGHNTPVKHGVTNKRELTTEHEVTSPGMKYNIRTLFSAAEEAKERAAKNEIIRAQEQDIKDREKERQLGDKLSAKREPKEFIKSSKPREKKAFMDEMMSDSSSYLQEIITPEEQAKREVNFIGDAFYYNLTKSVVLPDLAGDYVIVYTRPVGSKFDPEGRSATYSPSMANKFSIITQLPSRRGRGEVLGQMLLSGCWAAGTLSIHGAQTVFGCENIYPNSINCHATTVRMRMVAMNKENPDKTPLAGCILKDTGSTMTFGMTVMGYVKGEDGEKEAICGFHFVQMEVACFNTITSELERQVIVGVKIPKREEGNVSSAFILKQRFSSSRDLCILDLDPRVRDNADWFTYGVRDQYRDRTPIPGWAPHHPEHLGMDELRFNACDLEAHLLNKKDPIRELGNLAQWLGDFKTIHPRSREELVIYEAHCYMESRLKMMRAELRLREEVGRLEASEPVQQTMEMGRFTNQGFDYPARRMRADVRLHEEAGRPETFESVQQPMEIDEDNTTMEAVTRPQQEANRPQSAEVVQQSTEMDVPMQDGVAELERLLAKRASRRVGGGVSLSLPIHERRD